MRIKLNKDFTTVNGVELAKEAMRDFKARYTDNDIRCIISNEFDVNLIGDVLLIDMDVWNNDISGDYEKSIFYVNSMVIDTWFGFIKVSSVTFNLEFEFINRELCQITRYNPSDEG